MEVFRPKRSFGWVWALVIVLAALEPEEKLPSFAWAIIVAIYASLFVFFVAVAVFFPAMRYEFGPDDLVLSYGPILRYRIPYGEVRAVHREDLHVQLWSSLRWPGLALYKVPYSGLGPVRTRAGVP